MNNNNKKIDDLETDIATVHERVKPALVSANPALTRTKVNDTAEQTQRQKRQSESVVSLKSENLSKSVNEGNFTSLLGKFQLRHQPDLPRSHAAIDILLTLFCFATVHYAYLGSLNLTSQRSIALFSALIFISFSMYVGTMYSSKRLRSLNRELTYLTLCWMFAFAALGLFAFLTKTAMDISRVWVTSSMILSLVLLAGIRALGSLGFMAGSKENARNIVILGSEISIDPVLRDLVRLPNSLLRVARVFEISKHRPGTPAYADSLKQSASQLTQYIEHRRQLGTAIEQVWIAVSENQPQIVEELSEALINSSVDVCVVPDLYTERLLKGDVERYGNTELVNVSEISLPLAADQFKRVLDIVIASIALLFLFIPMIVIAALIKLESSGPALFRQKRYGVDGREIEILKFRSMLVHTDNKVQQASKNDARVTGVGKFIRRTSLDELPQLLNVLKGTMSLVGPRPHAVAHNELWRHEIHGYMLRHKVRPGITGWAQVHGWRGETDTVYKMQQRVKYDLEYIQHWSPWLDLKILFLTVFVGFAHKNAY